MHFIFRTFLVWLKRNGPRIGLLDVGRIAFRVLPTDIDVMGHMNNGIYLSVLDLGRMDLLQRSGAWSKMIRAGILPVMANATITYRKSLLPWKKFWVETRIVGYDEKAVYMEQRMVIDGEIYAQATLRGRFVKKSGGVASIAEFAAATGMDLAALPPAGWIDRWVADTSLPPTKASAPSLWG